MDTEMHPKTLETCYKKANDGEKENFDNFITFLAEMINKYGDNVIESINTIA